VTIRATSERRLHARERLQGHRIGRNEHQSWEKAASAAINRAAKSLRDLRVAEVVQLDMQIEDGKVKAYRAKVKVSFKFEGQ